MVNRAHAACFMAAYGGRGSSRRQRGTVTVEKLIMIGMIVVPIVVLLIIFKDKLSKWYSETVTNLFSTSDTYNKSSTDAGGINMPAAGK